MKYEITVSFFDDGKPAETFVRLDMFVRSNPLEHMVADAAVAVSLGLQYGVPADVMRKAFLREDNGEPMSIFGKIMDMIEEEG